MPTANIVHDARVMAKGQVTIPKHIRAILGIESGGRVTFVAENGSVRVINSRVYAKQKLQEETQAESEKRSQRIGVAKGKFTVPDDFDKWDADIASIFEGYFRLCHT